MKQLCACLADDKSNVRRLLALELDLDLPQKERAFSRNQHDDLDRTYLDVACRVNGHFCTSPFADHDKSHTGFVVK